MAKGRATSRDVAERAGVSRATVSYVLNKAANQTIPPETQNRVRAAALELGYTPNAAAKALRSARSQLVLLVIRDVAYARNIGLAVDRLASLASTRGLSLVTWIATAEQPLSIALSHLQPRFVITFAAVTPDEDRTMTAARIPFARHRIVAPEANLNDVAGVLQVRHLAEGGHRTVGVLTTEDGSLGMFARPRLDGARRACLELGLAAPLEATVHVPPDGHVDEIVEILQAWRQGSRPVDGIVCYNDQIAALAMAAARRLGLGVPDDVAIIGVEDDPMAVLLDPPLTTVAIDMCVLADELWAAGLAAAGEDAPQSTGSAGVLRLVHRGST